jgi:Uma2 family endonuclease
MSISPLPIQTNSFFDDLKNVTDNLNLKDQIYITTEVSWSEYEAITQHFVDQSHYRISYLEGTLQIMSPGRNHEIVKKHISNLLEAYFQEAEIDYYPLASTTLRVQKKQAGKEPDESYCLETEKEFPDLAIEVIYSSGNIDILEIYKRLQVKEVWLWQNNELKIYCLDNNEYAQVISSQVLPNLDIKFLIKYVSQPNLRLAVKEFRQEVRENK